jgi:glycosyltransferase involved in cell wall biosynthesis
MDHARHAPIWAPRVYREPGAREAVPPTPGPGLVDQPRPRGSPPAGVGAVGTAPAPRHPSGTVKTLLLCIHSLGRGGAERVTVTLANHWSAQGRHVTIATLAGTGEVAYPLSPAVGRIALNLARPSRGWAPALGANLRRVLALRAVLRREHPDVAIGMMGTTNVLLAVAGLGLDGIRVASERVHPPRVPLGRSWERLRAATYRWLDAVVVQTEQSRVWVSANTSARRVVAIPNPVAWPLPEREPRRPPESVGRPTHARLLAVGRLERQKGFDLLIDAFAALPAVRELWDLVIVGEGPEREALTSQVVARGLAGAVHLPGEVGNLGEWYSHADLFALASRFEGFPNVLVEAMASGLPVVAADCETGPRDIIRPGVDGILVPPEEVEALARGLADLMADADRRRGLGRRAKEVRDRFAIERIAAAWEAVFQGEAGT